MISRLRCARGKPVVLFLHIQGVLLRLIYLLLRVNQLILGAPRPHIHDRVGNVDFQGKNIIPRLRMIAGTIWRHQGILNEAGPLMYEQPN